MSAPLVLNVLRPGRTLSAPPEPLVPLLPTQLTVVYAPWPKLWIAHACRTAALVRALTSRHAVARDTGRSVSRRTREREPPGRDPALRREPHDAHSRLHQHNGASKKVAPPPKPVPPPPQ